MLFGSNRTASHHFLNEPILVHKLVPTKGPPHSVCPTITIDPCSHPMSATSAMAYLVYLENMHDLWLGPQQREPSFFE